MNQIDLRGRQVVEINYSWRSLSPAIQIFQPIVYKQDDIYCCLLGSPETGIFGSGSNPKQAMQEWEQNFHNRIATGDMGDEVVAYVLAKLAASRTDVHKL